MRIRSFKLFGALMVIAAAAVSFGLASHATAVNPDLGLEVIHCPPSGPIDFQVTVDDPALMGGYAELYRTDGTIVEHLMTFVIESPMFMVTSPPGAGNETYWYTAFDLAGVSAGSSNTVAPFEPDFIPED
jgi:hypothetical protein